MMNYIRNGYARKLTMEEVQKRSRRTWYLPYHPVYSEHKPGKIRKVFNAAVEHDGMSLSNALLTGLDMLNKLPVYC